MYLPHWALMEGSMKLIRRLIAEWKSPAKKCARVGHNVRIWIEVDLFGLQIMRTKAKVLGHRQKETFCKRCGIPVRVYGYLRAGDDPPKQGWL